MPEDIRRKNAQIKILIQKIPKYLAGSAEKMKDANFSAQGFVFNGHAKKWPKRKYETKKTKGKRILHGRGILQSSVKANALSDHIQVGVDLSKVPYAKIHNEGGAVIQYVRPHTRKNHRTRKRYQVKSFSRKIRYPQRRFLGFSPDIIKGTEREIRYQFDKIMKS